MKITGPVFEVKECAFVDTPAGSTSQFRNKMELLDKYKEKKEVTQK